MSEERRGSKRQPVEYPVWIDTTDGRVLRGMLRDASETGARVRMDIPSDLPVRVLLRLTEAASPRRVCDVIWRSETELGLRFQTRAAAFKKKGWIG
jgi:hypothetical protein